MGVDQIKVAMMIYAVFKSISAWYDEQSYHKPVTDINSKTELAEILKKFYMSTRRKDGLNYKVVSYMTIRRALTLIFQRDYGMKDVDIQSDSEFEEANAVFSHVLKSLRGREESSMDMYEPWRLTTEKIVKLYNHGQLGLYDTQYPKTLLQTVYFYVCFYTGVGKLSVMKRITVEDVHEVVENDKLVAYRFDLRKYLPAEGGLIPFTIRGCPGKPWCPVLTIREYIAHRNMENIQFFQKALTREQCIGSQVWYKKCRFKDIYPLSQMCRDAGISPALAGGCFNKKRISSEIRFDLNLVYARVYPNLYVNSNAPVPSPYIPVTELVHNVRPLVSNTFSPANVVTIVRDPTDPSLNQPPSNAKPVYTITITPVESTTVTTSDANNSSVQSLNADRRSTRSSPGSSMSLRPYRAIRPAFSSTRTTASESSTVSSFASNPSRPVSTSPSETIRHGAPATADGESISVQMIQREGAPSMATHARGQTIMYGHHHHHHQSTVVQTPQQPTLNVQPTVIATSYSNYAAILPNNASDSPTYTTNTYTSRAPSQAESPANFVPSFAVTRQNSTTALHSPPPLQVSGVSQAENEAPEPPPKRTRFGEVGNTFLRDISASAREQGKGAVLLMLRLLDDLSDGRGKDLLKDILQEMKIM